MLICGSIFAQSQIFTDSLYLQQLETFMSPVYKVHPDVQVEIDKFKENWNSGFIDELKFGIVYVSNTMNNSFIKPYPNFYNYISTVNALVTKKKLDYYREWEVGFLQLLQEKKLNLITPFLETSKLLIKDSVIFQNNSITWKVLSTNYVIGNDPQTQTMYVNFNSDFNLLCFNTKDLKSDTIRINNTAGVFYPTEQKFEGRYGEVYWKNKNFSKGEIFVKFQKYNLDLNQAKFAVENVSFTNSYLNLFQIEGKIDVKLIYNNSQTTSPVFESYNTLTIEKVFPDVDFHGYIKMQGTKLFGIGKDEPAYIFIKDKNKNLATLRSYNFELNTDSLIYAGSSEFTFYLNNHLDSIYHSNVEFRYVSKLNNTLFRDAWFNFNTKSGNYLIISREDQGASSSALSDSYHKLNIYSDKLVWAKGDSLLYLVTTYGSNKDYVNFESQNYFDNNLYDYFSGKGTDNVNHFAEIKSLQDSLNKIDQIITIPLYQKKLKQSRNQQLSTDIVEKIFQKLSYSDFVIYNRQQKTIVPTKKLYTYLSNSARLRKADSSYADFDRLVITSQLGSPSIKGTNIGVNAILSLSNDDLNIKKVNDLWLSSDVKLMTNNIIVKKNRDFVFSGTIGAGLVKLSGANFEYVYKDNQIKILDTNTTMNLWYIDTLANGKYSYFPISTTIKNIDGKVLVNLPNNKSNTLNNVEYPKLLTKNNSKITYEKFVAKYSTKDSSKNGKFDFYFDANDFILDSLSYLNKNALKFKGTIHTGLFAPLSVTYNVREGVDSNFLGFQECTESNPELKNGLEFKGGKFYGCFILNDDGLYGKGYIYYYSAQVFSQNFIFLPNRVIAKIDSVFIDNSNSLKPDINEDIPYVVGRNLNFDWIDNMDFSYSPKLGKNEISLYSQKLDNKAILNGKLVYNNDSLIGSGTFIFKDADLVDSNFIFKENSFDVNKCDFNLKIQKSSLFVTKNLNGHVDIIQQMGSFYSNDDTSRILFAENKYVCIMDHFLWKIGEGIVNIGGVMPGKDSSNYVNSIDEKIEKGKTDKQIKLFGTVLVNTIDTLTFNAASTTYDINNKVLIADNVKSMKIADAMIYPMGKVKIFKGGLIDTLKDVSFEFPFNIFNPEKQKDYLHSFHNATVLIRNRFNYSAFSPKFNYPYLQQSITFDKAFTSNSPQSYSELQKYNASSLAKIYSKVTKNTKTTDSLYLNRHFIYQGDGDIQISADKRYPQFDGYAKIDTSCDIKKIPIDLFKVSSVPINSDTIKMPFSSVFPSQHGNVNSGLYWTIVRNGYNSEFAIRHLFVGRLRDAKTWDIFKPEGEIYYNNSIGEYRIAKGDMLYSNRPDTLAGNFMAYNKNLCLLRAQGNFNLFMNWDATEKQQITHVKSVTKGFYRYNLANEVENFQVSLGLDFIAPEPIMKNLIDQILANPDNQSIFDKNKERTIRNYDVFLGKDTTNKILDEITNYFDYTLPPILKHTIMFSDVNFVFNSDSSFLASDGNIGISNINGIKVDRYVKGYIKYRLHPETRMLIIILEPSPGVIYGFKYRFSDRGVMKFYLKTGNQVIDYYFDKLKPKDKKFKDNYEISESNEGEFKAFAKEYFNKK